MYKFKQIVRSLTPPIVLHLRRGLFGSRGTGVISLGCNPDKQDTDLYWDEAYANVLEQWGVGTVWDEIQLLFAGLQGKVLDIACGTGPTIEILNKFQSLEVYGFDLSDVLINRAMKKGIDKSRLKVADATKRVFSYHEFDYSYSIGSIEHFTEDGIRSFLENAAFYTSKYSFHMLPANVDDKDKGWEKTSQSYFNNSVAWWLERFVPHFRTVTVVDSSWAALDQKGKWFICECSNV